MLVKKLMAEAEGSPRLMALTSLQLAKLISRNPVVLQLYTGEYIKMLLYGPTMNDNAFPGTALEVSRSELQTPHCFPLGNYVFCF